MFDEFPHAPVHLPEDVVPLRLRPEEKPSAVTHGSPSRARAHTHTHTGRQAGTHIFTHTTHKDTRQHYISHTHSDAPHDITHRQARIHTTHTPHAGRHAHTDPQELTHTHSHAHTHTHTLKHLEHKCNSTPTPLNTALTHTPSTWTEASHARTQIHVRAYPPTRTHVRTQLTRI